MHAAFDSRRAFLLVILLGLFLVFAITVYAGAETSVVSFPLYFEIPGVVHCSGEPAWIVVDGIWTEHTTVNKNSTHVHSSADFDVMVLDGPGGELISSERTVRTQNTNLNNQNSTDHIIHHFNGTFTDGSEWQGTLVEHVTLNASSDVSFDFKHFQMHCP